MISYLGDLLACRTPNQFHRLHRRAGDIFTPLEIDWLIDRDFSLPSLTREWLAAMPTRGYFLDSEPERYQRAELAPDVNLYSDPDHPAHRKRLVIGFCSYAHRLLMPTGSFLQMLPSALFDVVILADRSKSHYLRGLPDLATDLPGLCRWRETKLSARSYADIVCYGTSAGGFTALRAGHLLGAPRSISMCGRFPGQVQRLTENLPGWLAFDLLCECITPGSEYVAIYSEKCERDRRDADGLARIAPVTHVMTLGRDTHVRFSYLAADRVRALHARMLDFPVERPFDDTGEGVAVWKTRPTDFAGSEPEAAPARASVAS